MLRRFLVVIFSAATLMAQPAARLGAGLEHTVDKLFGMVEPSDSSPLTEKKRFHLYVVSAAGPVPILGEAAGAGISHWEDTPPEWGQGWGAYGKRFGSNLAYNGVRGTITYGTSILFHEDDRYFASHK